MVLHLDQDHGRDLLRGEGLLSPMTRPGRWACQSLETTLKGQCFMSAWTALSLKLAADQALGVEDGVGRVDGGLVLGGVADKALRVGEGDVGRGGAVTLVVGDDLEETRRSGVMYRFLTGICPRACS